MKFTKIAASLVAVLGVASVGGSYFTGKMAEDKYNAYLTKANQDLKIYKAAYGIDAQIENVEFNRHFFDSDVKYQLVVKLADGENYVFNGNDKLFHGPFPLNRLKQGKLMPVLASAQSQVSAPEALKANVGNPEGIFLTADSEISYAGKYSGDAKTSPFKFENQAQAVEIAASTFRYQDEEHLAMQIPSLKMVDKEENTQFDVEGIEYEADLFKDKSYSNINIGAVKGNIKGIHILEKDKKGEYRSHLTDFTFSSKGDVSQDRANSTATLGFAMSLDSEHGHADLGKLSTEMAISLDAKTTNDIAPMFSQYTDFQTPQILDAVLGLFGKPTQFHIKSLAFENTKGKSDIALALNTEGFNPAQLRNLKDLLAIFKQSSLSVTNNLAQSEELVKQFLSISDKAEDRANAESLAKENIASWVAQAKQSGLAEVDEQNIRLNLAIDGGKVTLNGKEVPEKDVEMALFMLAMGLGSMSH